jgi:citrate lyase subunit beta/citryl-CoA lyase/(S)-citramalyl-CoA lyase
MAGFRSLLFVPGSRPDRFGKACASGADAVCIDLEDAVAPDLKDGARRETFQFLSVAPARPAVGFRINALTTPDGLRDLIALLDSGAAPAFLMIPKARGGFDLEQVAAVLDARCPPLWPLLETPEALAHLPGIAAAAGPRGGIMFGGADYSASIGSDMGWDALYQARASIVAAAAMAGCATMDVPFLDVRDEAGLRADSARVRAMGFLGRASIHPSQVAAINEIFSPSAEEVSKAERIAAAYREAEGGVALLDGKLIEKPVLRAAERVLAAKTKQVDATRE